jgi:hypothetical protein
LLCVSASSLVLLLVFETFSAIEQLRHCELVPMRQISMSKSMQMIEAELTWLAEERYY